MTTTIQIDDETKKKLFRIKLRLEEQKGEAITYNDLIEYLIESQSSNLIRKSNLQEFRSLKGILPKSTKKTYLDERRKDLNQEEKLAPIKE
ncbi:hypothetical protein ES703_59491 [subsurface metagenome]